MLQQLSYLVALAREALIVSIDREELFVEKVTAYLEQFESWRTGIEQQGDSGEESILSSEECRPQLELLQKLHQEVLSRATVQRDLVAHQLGEIHRRAQALKKYVDRYPSRITIAGKREG